MNFCFFRMGCDMSKLIYTFGALDPRVRMLINALKGWGKAINIVENGGLSNKLTNFQLTSLAIFYLQQLTPPILPSIADLKRNTESGPTSSDYGSNLAIREDLFR